MTTHSPVKTWEKWFAALCVLVLTAFFVYGCRVHGRIQAELRARAERIGR